MQQSSSKRYINFYQCMWDREKNQFLETSALIWTYIKNNKDQIKQYNFVNCSISNKINIIEKRKLLIKI